MYILNAMPDTRRGPRAGGFLMSLHHAVVAQVVERILGKDEVRQFESAQQLQRYTHRDRDACPYHFFKHSKNNVIS